MVGCTGAGVEVIRNAELLPRLKVKGMIPGNYLRRRLAFLFGLDGYVVDPPEGGGVVNVRYPLRFSNTPNGETQEPGQ